MLDLLMPFGVLLPPQFNQQRRHSGEYGLRAMENVTPLPDRDVRLSSQEYCLGAAPILVYSPQLGKEAYPS